MKCPVSGLYGMSFNPLTNTLHNTSEICTQHLHSLICVINWRLHIDNTLPVSFSNDLAFCKEFWWRVVSFRHLSTTNPRIDTPYSMSIYPWHLLVQKENRTPFKIIPPQRAPPILWCLLIGSIPEHTELPNCWISSPTFKAASFSASNHLTVDTYPL